MSIFRRDTDVPSQPPQKAPPKPALQRAPAAADGRDRTYIASGSKVVGEISGSAELVIDGRVEGKIDLASRLVVGSTGEVEGELQARSIQIAGRVLGNVEGLERVEVLKSGRLEGDMVAPQNGVHIAEGAFFSGKIDMTRAAGDRAGKAPAVASPARQGEAPKPEEEAKSGGAGPGGGPDTERGKP